MNNPIIDKNLIIKISSFLKKAKSLGYLDIDIFEKIDGYKEITETDFNSYYLEYINSLPKLDFANAVKIAKEVYQLYGKENEFDEILNRLVNNQSVDNGSLNKDDSNCITKASESRILLSGTYYDVILLCHEIGHKLKSINYMNQHNMMDGFFFETPSIIFELSANDYLRDNYGIDINADELRKKHILTIKRENNVENSIFLIIMNLLREKRLNAANLYVKFIKNADIVKYLSYQDGSIEESVEEAMSVYSYDIGYILGNHIKNRNDRNEMLNMILNYKDNGLSMPFSIDEQVIKETLNNQKFVK